MRSRTIQRAAYVAFVIVSMVSYGAVVSLRREAGSPLHGPQLQRAVLWLLFSFLAYVVAATAVEIVGGIRARWIWGAAVLFRVIVLFAEPTLSSDVYRYLWDGHVANEGVSPYAYALDAPELDDLHVPVREMANHTWMASPYLPAAQPVFRIAALSTPLRPLPLQLLMLLFDLGIGLLIAKLLELTAIPGYHVLLYLWNPLIIIEFANNAHVDAWMILLSFAAVYYALQQTAGWRQMLAPVFLALAILTKPVPALLFPILVWKWDWQQRIIFAAALLLVLVPAGLRAGWGLDEDLSGTGLFGALRVYNDQWNYNSGLFHWLEIALGAPGFGRPLPLAKSIVFSFLALVELALFWNGRRSQDTVATLRSLSVAAMAYLLLLPTVHPWYASILVAFLPFLSRREEEPCWAGMRVLPWLYLSGALLLSYLTYYDPANPAELEWVRRLEWIPTLALLALGLLARPLVRSYRIRLARS